MSLIKKLAGETVIYGLSNILSRLLNFVFLTFYLTRIFEQQEYGIVSEFYVYIALLMVFFTFRMETTFFRFASKEKEGNKAFSTASIFILGLTLMFTSVLLLNAQAIANYLQYPEQVNYVFWFVFIVAADALAAIPFARLRLENKPLKFAAIKLLNVLVNIFFIFFFLEIAPRMLEAGWGAVENIYDENDKIKYVFIANFLASATVLLILLPSYFKQKLNFDIDLWKKMLWYALPLLVVGFAAIINQLINIPMMKAYLPGDLSENLKTIGVYSASYKLAILMSLFIQAFNYAAEPFFFREADRKDAKEIYAKVALAFNMVASLVFLGILFYIDLIKYFVGPNFRSALDVVPVLLLAFWFLGLYYNFSIWYKLKDKTNFGAYISVVGAAITIGLNLLLIPKIGYFGAAWSALACYGFMAFAGYLLGRKYYPIPYDIKRIILYILAAVFIYWISTFVNIYFEGKLLWNLVLKTILLAGFLFFVYLIDGRNIRQLLK